MKGVYTFSQNGRVVGTQENLITTAGRKTLLEFVAGYQRILVGTLSVGVGSAAAAVSDRGLNFEVSRQAVIGTGIDYGNNSVIFRSQLPATEEYVLYEIGASSSTLESVPFGSMLLLDFNPLDAWTAGTWVATNSRMGSALQLTSAASTTTETSLSGLTVDLSGYSDLDKFVTAIRANNAFVGSLAIRFMTDASNYFTWTIASPASGVYTVASTTRGAVTATGAPSWSNITQIAYRVTATSGGTASIDLDGLRVEDSGTIREDNVLISRAVLGTPVTKTPGIPLDIEYAITL